MRFILELRFLLKTLKRFLIKTLFKKQPSDRCRHAGRPAQSMVVLLPVGVSREHRLPFQKNSKVKCVITCTVHVFSLYQACQLKG